jgi:hypothetical protein
VSLAPTHRAAHVAPCLTTIPRPRRLDALIRDIDAKAAEQPDPLVVLIALLKMVIASDADPYLLAGALVGGIAAEDLFEQLRREHEFGIGTIAGMAVKFGVHPGVVRRAIASALPPPHRYTGTTCGYCRRAGSW